MEELHKQLTMMQEAMKMLETQNRDFRQKLTLRDSQLGEVQSLITRREPVYVDPPVDRPPLSASTPYVARAGTAEGQVAPSTENTRGLVRDIKTLELQMKGTAIPTQNPDLRPRPSPVRPSEPACREEPQIQDRHEERNRQREVAQQMIPYGRYRPFQHSELHS